MTEAEFLEHIKTIEKLLRHYAGRLEATRGVSAGDTVQDALLALWKLRDKAAAHPAPSRFFAQAGRWRMARYARTERGRRSLALDGVGEMPDTREGPTPCEFDTLVSLAPARFHDLLSRVFMDGVPVKEIAASRGVTTQAVRQSLAAALGHVRSALVGPGAGA